MKCLKYKKKFNKEKKANYLIYNSGKIKKKF